MRFFSLRVIVATFLFFGAQYVTAEEEVESQNLTSDEECYGDRLCDNEESSVYNCDYAYGFCNCGCACEPLSDCAFARKFDIAGIWFPEDPPLFRPFIADPRQICYSAGWRFNDNALTKHIIGVSYGDSIGFYRWYKLPWRIPGQFQIGLDGALWAVFDPVEDSAPLINADYYVGGNFSWAWCNWGARVRIFHISSHIGDEFLLEHPGFDRKNPSAEYLDLFISNYITEDIRIYGGLGYIIHQDTSFKTGRFYAEGGLELRLHEWGFVSWYNRVYGTPFFGMHFRYRSDFKHHADSTYVIGYEIGKLSGLCHRLRFFLEYHDGYSLEGQFSRCHTNYLSLRISYGF